MTRPRSLEAKIPRTDALKSGIEHVVNQKLTTDQASRAQVFKNHPHAQNYWNRFLPELFEARYQSPAGDAMARFAKDQGKSTGKLEDGSRLFRTSFQGAYAQVQEAFGHDHILSQREVNLLCNFLKAAAPVLGQYDAGGRNKANFNHFASALVAAFPDQPQVAEAIAQVNNAFAWSKGMQAALRAKEQGLSNWSDPAGEAGAEEPAAKSHRLAAIGKSAGAVALASGVAVATLHGIGAPTQGPGTCMAPPGVSAQSQVPGWSTVDVKIPLTDKVKKAEEKVFQKDLSADGKNESAAFTPAARQFWPEVLPKLIHQACAAKGATLSPSEAIEAFGKSVKVADGGVLGAVSGPGAWAQVNEALADDYILSPREVLLLSGFLEVSAQTIAQSSTPETRASFEAFAQAIQKAWGGPEIDRAVAAVHTAFANA